MRRAARKAATAVGAVMIAAAVGIGTWLWTGYRSAAAPEPSAQATETEALGQRFPDVDWDKWREKAPDLVGWVSVPGTDVSYPVVQAPESDGAYYLHHNSAKQWSAWGCPYLASDRSRDGLLSSVPLVYGHHMNDGSMFSALSGYTDAKWARKHRKVLVQTPEWRAVLKVRGARVANASAESAPAERRDVGSLQGWAAAELAKCPVRLGSGKVESNQVYVFVTCSYGTYADQRTLVYAVPTAYERT